jgi:hypothetical protein
MGYEGKRIRGREIKRDEEREIIKGSGGGGCKKEDEGRRIKVKGRRRRGSEGRERWKGI